MKPSDSNPSGASPSHHRIYGIDFTGDFPFTVPLSSGQEAPCLEVSLGRRRTAAADALDTPLYVSPFVSDFSEPLVTLYAADGATRLHFPSTGDFLVSPNRITYCPSPQADFVLAETLLLGPVFSYWLEEHGRPVLHASTVEVKGAGVAFLSASHGGKSSLAAALLRAGAALVSDDLLVVEQRGGQWLAHPAYAQIRMWPEQTRHFLGDHPNLAPVHPLSAKLRAPVDGGFGRFAPLSVPLRVLYLPERRESDGDLSIHIQPSPASAGLLALVRHSFLSVMLHHLGRQSARLPMLAELARSVSIRTLSFPSGFEYLPAVAAAIIEDVKAVCADTGS